MKTIVSKDDPSTKTLWKWTGVSGLVHILILAILCTGSYMIHQKHAAEEKRKAEEKEKQLKIAAEKEAAAHPEPAAQSPVAVSAPKPEPQSSSTNSAASAEKILGIDQVAKPEEIPKTPFSNKDDDLLKDLK